MKNLLLVIDVQKAFINENTIQVVERIRDLINNNEYDNVIFTRFINYNDSIWVQKLNYKECITDDSKRLMIDTKNNLVFDKNKYSALTNELKKYFEDNKIDNIYLCGIDTECCILKTALDLFEDKYNVYVLKNYCACTHGELRHNNAIEILKRNIGEKYVI